MTSFEEAETEETVTCLHLTFYHPGQDEKMMFRCLNFCKREQVRADDVAKFGRDSSVCRYNLMDTRVSRIQFSLQFYRKLQFPILSSLNIRMHFSINHSKKTIIITEGRDS
uniref:TRAF interacting protein with forkhead associated domain n=1 Tax=Cyanistes caeruleus TaxID=156563 RepID=A0A8C0VSK1_CYACU